MEKLLSGGYSSVHTRLDFDTEIFTPKSVEYTTRKDKMVENLSDFYGYKDEKKQRKILMSELYNLWKQENLNSGIKLIDDICLDGKDKSSKRRVFSKIFKLDENNQYGFAMTKPLPIGIL